MNIEAYDAESLRRLVRSLQQENSALKEKLNRIGIPFETTNREYESFSVNSI